MLQPQTKLSWVKDGRNYWLRLLDINPHSLNTHGVYVVWHGGFPGRTVRVGGGDLRKELAACAADPRVSNLQEYGQLFVTWAEAAPRDCAGIVAYLSERLRPLVTDPLVEVVPVEANAPF